MITELLHNENAWTLLKTAMLTPEGRQKPYPLLRKLHEHGTHCMTPEGTIGVYGYRAVDEMIRSRQFLKNSDPVRASVFSTTTEEQLRELRRVSELEATGLVFLNPPDHGRIRDIANKGFRPSHLAALRAFIQQQIDRLLRDVDVTQPFELMGSFSSLFAPEIVGELIGLPHDKRPLIAEQTSRQLRGVDPGASYEQRLDSARARHEMCDYVREVIAERRAAPRDDFITALVQSSDEQKTTSDAELTALVQILYVGGYETTSHMIGNGIVALLSNPEQYALLCAEPKRISEAVDEMLRFDGPIATTVLVAGEGATIDGSPVKAGTLCFGLLGAANHDPSVFEHPERFDITRRRSKHLAFGTGIHFCLGAGLARVELELVFSEFTRRFPRMKLLQPADELRRLPVFHQRAYEQVPLLLEP